MSGETLSLVYLSVAKVITYLGFFGVTGAVTVQLLVLPICHRRGILGVQVDGTLRRQIQTIALTSAVLLVCAALARLYAQTYSVFGFDEPVTLNLMELVALETRWGAQWVTQAEVALFTVLGVGLTLLMPAAGWWLVAGGTGALAVTLPMTGHAMSHSGGSFLPWMLQAGHGVAGGLWLGTLAAVVAVIVSARVRKTAERDLVTTAVINAYSPVAVVSVAAVVVTGAATATLYISDWSQLWLTSYGLTLVGKVVLVLATGSIGAYNWTFIRPRLGIASTSTEVTRSASLELVIAFIVLTVTAVLVHLPAPHE